MFTLQDFKSIFGHFSFNIMHEKIKYILQIFLERVAQWAKDLRSNRKVASSAPPGTCPVLVSQHHETLFIFYKNSFYKNHEAENRPKIKNFVRITPDSRSRDL